jgi:DNA-binding transcriptional LysR family regulator
LIRDEIQNGELIPLLDDIFQKEIGIYMYYEKNNFVKPKVREFVAIALDICRNTKF